MQALISAIGSGSYNTCVSAASTKLHLLKGEKYV
jgi:hypothetical protein